MDLVIKIMLSVSLLFVLVSTWKAGLKWFSILGATSMVGCVIAYLNNYMVKI